MAAQCDGRLVDWFSPAAAEAMFLSSAYLQERHKSEKGYNDKPQLIALEVLSMNTGKTARLRVRWHKSFRIALSVSCILFGVLH